MRPIEHIRRNVFRLKQGPFAEIAGTTQPSVSRWERGEQNPDAAEMARIRDAAREQGLEWDDSLFFEVPPTETPQPAQASA
jgi:transcriptional regulator with XRE-family HTH domain